MRLPVYFTYEATFARRRAQAVVIADQVEGEIVELTEIDAPIGARLCIAPPDPKFATALGRQITLRSATGGFWEAVTEGKTKVPVTRLRLEQISGNPAALTTLLWHAAQHMAVAMGKVPFPSIEAANLGQPVSTNRDTCLARALDLTDRYRLIGGVLHQRSSEPVYVKDRFGRITGHLLHLVDGIDRTNIYRGDQHDVLLNYAMGLPSAKQDDALDAAIDLRTTEGLTWNRAEQMLYSAAEALIAKMARCLTTADDAQVQQWLALRAALRGSDRNEIERQLPPTIEAFRLAGGGAISARDIDGLMKAARRELRTEAA